MKKFLKTVAVTLSLVLFTAAFSACAGTSYGPLADGADYASIVAATYGDEEIMLSEANYFLRSEQWGFESIYWSFYTSYGYTNPWEAPYNEYKTMGEYIKELVMTQIYQTRVLIDHASEYELDYDKLDKDAIEKAAQDLFDSHDETFFDYAPVTVEEITKWLTDNTLANKVYEAVKEEAQVSASAEETEVYTASYLSFDDESEAREFYGKLEADGDYDTLVEDGEYSSSEEHILKVLGEDEEETLLYKNTHELKTGEFVIYEDEENSKWYVAIVTNDDDKEATEEKMESVLDEKREDYFLEVYEKWTKEAPAFKTTDAWDSLVITGGETIIPPTTEAAEEEEADGGEDETGEVIPNDEDAIDDVEVPQVEATDPNEASN